MKICPDFRSDKGRKQIKRWLILNVFLLALVGLLSFTYPVEELSRRIEDTYFRLHGSQSVSPHVALVLIDDASLNRYGRWPWKRSLLAQVVRAASVERPKALGLDILLSEAEDGRDDHELAQALKQAGNVVLVAKISNSQQGPLWVEPLPLFAQSAAAIGHAEAALGPDSICRSVPVRELSLEGPRWAFALEVARVAQGVRLEDNGRYVRLGETRIPTMGPVARVPAAGTEIESPHLVPIDYRGQIVPGASISPFSAVSVADLLEGRAGGQLEGKAVLIGFGSTEIGDRLPTPVSDRVPMPGVEIHANLVDALMAGRTLQPLGTAAQILLLLAFALGSTWVILRWPGWRGLLVLGTLLVGGIATGYVLFANAHRLTELGPFLCAGILAGPVAQLQNFILLDRDLTEGLRQLQRALRSVTPSMGGNLSTALRPQMASSSGDLHWKIHLLRLLQIELGSLYAFDQTLLAAMEEGLAVFSADGKLVFCNPRWQSFCQGVGWSQSLSLQEFAAALGEPRWRDWRAALSELGARLESEVHIGTGLWQFKALRLEATPLAGSSDLILVVATDQTARLERDRARAEALAFVTHELRTPLVSIQGFAEYLVRYPQKAGGEAAATIFRESGRLVAMINSYLDVLRLDAGSRPFQQETLDVSDIVNQVAKVARPLAEASEITVVTEIASDMPALLGDPHLITGVLLNLLGNAIKYSPHGSNVKLCAARDGETVVLEVWNPGPVIAPQELEHLCEPFYRTPEQEDSVPGWGLGLAFVKRIVERHGGQVEASSESSAGTCFRLLLPTAPVLCSEALQ